MLRRRAEILRGIRRFFDERGFIEVETAVAIPAPAPEEHIDCPELKDGQFLRASPELQMKKLLAQGMEKIYQIGPCFRAGERGSRHNPEFTMLEWYRKGEDYRAIAEDLRELLVSLGQTGEHCAAPIFSPRAQTISVRAAYRQWAQWDPWMEWDQDRFDFDMATKIEPALKAMGGGIFLLDYPPQAASLAKIRTPTSPPQHPLNQEDSAPELPCAERWEFYYDGMELANCFTELCDAAEQRARFLRAQANRQALGEADYPLDEDFLAQVAAMESAAGVALGIDRLVMVLTGASEISQVRAKI